MATTFACPACSKSLRIPATAAGRTARCPACQHRFQVPAAEAPSEVPLSLDEPHDAGGRRSSRGTLIGITLAVLVAGVAVAVLVRSGGSAKSPAAGGSTDQVTPASTPAATAAKDSVAERDKDYLRVLLGLYEYHGVLAGAKFWTGDHSTSAGFNDLRGALAANAAVRAFDPDIRTLDTASVEDRKSFTDWHGMDSPKWRPEFTKRYPERDVIFDEVAATIRDLCVARRGTWTEHLVLEDLPRITKELNDLADKDRVWNAKMAPSGPQVIDDRWHEYRMTYVSKEAPKLVADIRAKVRGLDSIVRLKAKVNAAK